MPPTPASPPATVAIRDDFDALMRTRGLNKSGAIARHIGVAESTITRLLKHETDPSARFVAAVLYHLGGHFEDYFQIR